MVSGRYELQRELQQGLVTVLKMLASLGAGAKEAPYALTTTTPRRWIPYSSSDRALLVDISGLAGMTFWRVVRSGALWASLKLASSVLRSTSLVREMPVIFRQLEEDREANMQGESFVYLQVIGVAPAHQGRGFGGKLLRALIERCEQTGMPLYLETETERNVSMYQRFGFRVVKQIVLPVIDLPMWEMVRQEAQR